MQQDKIEKLKSYFQNRQDVVMAFLFGSRAKKTSGKLSDWDIAVYFKTDSGEIEWEKKGGDYPEENNIWKDIMIILETDAVGSSGAESRGFQRGGFGDRGNAFSYQRQKIIFRIHVKSYAGSGGLPPNGQRIL